MAYEIPQQLEYKEKIMFNLTFKQLAYAFSFGGTALMLFTKLPYGIYINGLIALPFCILAILFMFLDFDRKLKDWLKWLKFRNADSEQKIKRFFGIKDFKDDLIIAENKLAVLKITPINFSIKSKGEQEIIMQIFRKFLNALDFPLQILMTTDVLDLQGYLDSLENKIDKRYSALFESYKKHLASTIASNSIMNRDFYIVIPEVKHIGIDIQLKICEEKLKNLNLEYKKLNTEELKKLIARFFNAKNNFLPESLKNNKDNFIVNDVFNRIIYASGYPRIVEAGFLDKIVSSVGNFDLSIHIEPYPIGVMMIYLNRELQKQRADLYAEESKGIINPSLEIKYNDTRTVLEQLQKGQDKLFNVSLYINCRASAKEELDLLTKKVEAELNSLLIIPQIANFRMAQGFKSAAPLGIDELKINRNITTEALSAFFPFTSPFLQLDETGVWLGLNKNNIPIIRDIFKLSNPNGVVLSQSGGGKSYFTKLLIARYLLNNVKVIVIDPQGEYKNLVAHFNGQRIDLSRTSSTMINPLDLMEHDYAEKRLSLMDLMQVTLGELSEPQKSFIDKALTLAYESKGINNNEETWENKPPILEDVLKILEKMEKRAITLEKTTIRSLINRLSMYVDGVFSFLNKHTNINFENNFVCFDISEMPKQVKPVIMFLVLDYVYMKMRKSIERKLLIIDESWSLLSRAEDSSYIFEIVKTCRKFNMGLLLINQEVEGLLNSEAGKSVLANSSYTLLMRQKPAVIQQVQETFHLSKAERAFLLTANVGEGILLIDDEHSEIRIVASPEEHKLITTNPDEILLQKEEGGKKMETPKIELKKEADMKEQPKVEVKPEAKKEIKQEVTQTPPAQEVKKFKPKTGFKHEFKKLKENYKKSVTVNVMEDKRCYKKADLSQEEIDYRLRHGYHESEQWDIETGKCEAYLLKPRFNESNSHLFLIYRIADYLCRFTRKVRTFEVNRPDIIFETDDGAKASIEVETGQMYVKKKEDLKKRIKQLNKEFGKNWFFVVTNKEWLWKYKQLGETITRKEVVEKINSFFTPPHKHKEESPEPQNSGLSTGGEDSLKASPQSSEAID